jgi:hypothetical protein
MLLFQAKLLYWRKEESMKASKLCKLVLLGGLGGSTAMLVGCNSSNSPPQIPEDEQVAAHSDVHVYPTWWWWYVHRPYFDCPVYSTHIVTYHGSGGTYVRTGGVHTTSYSYSSARSVTGAKVGGGSFKGGTSSSFSARGGFSGGRGGAAS